MSGKIRQTHRWVAMFFMATVIACIVALAVGVKEDSPAFSLFYLPLLPLVVLMVTGTYMFVLPYAAKWRSGRRSAR